GRTAWSDKHPAYDIVMGPSGTGLDDLFAPEINAIDDDVTKTADYDATKVAAVLNWIDGKDHSGAKPMPVPAIFGMNFQAVSVAEKKAGNGYKEGVPSEGLEGALERTDASLGKIVAELKAQKLADSTLVIITAKHGQSPMDASKRRIVDEDLIPGIINGVEKDLVAHIIADDGALIWLADPSKTADAVKALEAKKDEAGITRVDGPDKIREMFGDPGKDSRVPDLVVESDYGVIYAKTKATKIAEHGGNSEDDRHVGLLVSLPGLSAETVSERVATASVAPTILAALGLDPQKLQAVAVEKTPTLPGLDVGK
ncbi:MAG: alkaline phosphatase family protein, partial [Methylobacteriaceae bacterium]|nr:alkaline phosphatase family protein [Methylobacteriaceae bacterium]